MEKERFAKTTLLIVDAALLAGDELKKGFGTKFSIESKDGRNNLVTEYDHLAEKRVIDFLSSHVPNASFLAEERGQVGSSPSLFIIDPLDGTLNFAHNIPFFAVTIAFVFEGITRAAVTYNPLANELFVAEKGKGATLNGVAIEVSKKGPFDRAFLASGFPYNSQDNPYQCIDHFSDVRRLGLSTRELGSAALDLAYVAAGRFDAFFEASLAPWDTAAGALLVEEAKGVITPWDTTPFDIYSKKPLLASNKALHTSLISILNRAL